MSVLVAEYSKHGKPGVWIGADDCAYDRGFKRPTAHQKWRKLCERVWLGVDASPGAVDFRCFENMDIGAPGDPQVIADTLRAASNSGNYEALLVIDGKDIYHLFGYGSWAYLGGGFIAIGSGKAYAYGAAFSYDRSREYSHFDKLSNAVNAACEYDNCCGVFSGPRIEFVAATV